MIASVGRRLGIALGLLVLGFVIGLAAVALHQWTLGLLLGAAATLVTAYALTPGWITRLPYAVGWAVPIVLGMVPRPEGDYAIGGSAHGYGLVAVGMVLIVLTTATLPLGRRAPAVDTTGASTSAEPADDVPAAAPEATPAGSTDAERVAGKPVKRRR